MANFDETDVQFAVETRSMIAYRGERTVSVRKPDSGSRCTVMLGCAADGKKFPPYVIYKGKRGAHMKRQEGKLTLLMVDQMSAHLVPSITSPGHETPLASGVSTNVSVDVDTRQHDSEADVDARQHDPG
eukprot:scaffold30928_cov120-Amphora_coffeaeformis.AAC.1